MPLVISVIRKKTKDYFRFLVCLQYIPYCHITEAISHFFKENLQYNTLQLTPSIGITDFVVLVCHTILWQQLLSFAIKYTKTQFRIQMKFIVVLIIIPNGTFTCRGSVMTLINYWFICQDRSGLCVYYLQLSFRTNSCYFSYLQSIVKPAKLLLFL